MPPVAPSTISFIVHTPRRVQTASIVVVFDECLNALDKMAQLFGARVRFREGVLASPGRTRDLWKGATFESPSEQLERLIAPSATKGI